MSRIGKQPVPVPTGVDVTVDGLDVTVKGPKGELSATFPEGVAVAKEGDELVVSRGGDDPTSRSRHGLVRALLANMVTGVTDGFTKQLQMQGVGYRAIKKGSDVELQVGYSHPVHITAPEGITLDVPTQTEINVSGIDKALVGQVAADIRKVRPPEPYKGKGIMYVGERIRRKAGKAAGR